jgi:phosphoenolpyruvate synthase/pyruvate phosphate dikinase
MSIYFATHPQCTDPARVGGKAASLARCVLAGLPVPNFLVVDGDVDRDERDEFEAYVGKLTMPVAVRSSAVGEDGDEDSYAGQHDTFLNVDSPSKAWESYRQCVDSIHSDRAVAYRSTRRFTLQHWPQPIPHMAVIVQEMVDADASGVLFTRHPITDEETLVIEAGEGAGAVVDGTGGTVTLVTSEDASPTILVPHSDGSDPIEVPVQALADLADRLKAIYGDALDIEWAIQGGVLSLLQVRPITTTEAGGMI